MIIHSGLDAGCEAAGAVAVAGECAGLPAYGAGQDGDAVRRACLPMAQASLPMAQDGDGAVLCSCGAAHLPAYGAGVAAGSALSWQRAQFAAMPPRMREVASLVACGLGDHDVAAALTLEWRTVKSYLWQVYNRLGVRTRTQLAIVAIATGEVEVDQALQLWRRYAPEACGPDRQFQGETQG